MDRNCCCTQGCFSLGGWILCLHGLSLRLSCWWRWWLDSMRIPLKIWSALLILRYFAFSLCPVGCRNAAVDQSSICTMCMNASCSAAGACRSAGVTNEDSSSRRSKDSFPYRLLVDVRDSRLDPPHVLVGFFLRMFAGVLVLSP